MVTCQQLVEIVSDYLEGALSEVELTELEQHLEICEGCEIYVEQVRATITVLRTLKGPDEQVEPPPELLSALRASARDVTPNR